MVQRYDFVTGIETAAAPTATPASIPGDLFSLGKGNTFTLVNNQGAAADVTSAVWLKASYRSVFIKYHIYRSASGGLTRAQAGLLILVNDGTTWVVSPMSYGSVPDTGDAGVTFSITSGGQLQYVSDDNTGSYSAANSILNWKVLDLTEI